MFISATWCNRILCCRRGYVLQAILQAWNTHFLLVVWFNGRLSQFLLFSLRESRLILCIERKRTRVVGQARPTLPRTDIQCKGSFRKPHEKTPAKILTASLFKEELKHPPVSRWALTLHEALQQPVSRVAHIETGPLETIPLNYVELWSTSFLFQYLWFTFTYGQFDCRAVPC